MEENKNQQLAPLQMTKPVIQSLVTKELTALRYNETLQAASNLSFSKDNLATDYPALKELDRLLKLLDELRKKIKTPYDVVAKDIQSVFGELSKPLEEIRDQKKAELTKANNEALEEKKKAQAETLRKENVKATLVNFINSITKSVAEAATDKEITRLQQLIGTEKSKKTFYAEYYDELTQKCELMEEPIRIRKDFIKQKIENEKQLKSAISSGDFVKAAELKEEQDILSVKADESTVLLQEAAFTAAVGVETVIAEPIIETVKPRMTRWAWRVDDIALLHKKMPHLVSIIPNAEAIDVMFKTKKAEKELKDGEELNIFGLVFFQEKFY